MQRIHLCLWCLVPGETCIFEGEFSLFKVRDGYRLLCASSIEKELDRDIWMLVDFERAEMLNSCCFLVHSNCWLGNPNSSVCFLVGIFSLKPKGISKRIMIWITTTWSIYVWPPTLFYKFDVDVVLKCVCFPFSPPKVVANEVEEKNKIILICYGTEMVHFLAEGKFWTLGTLSVLGLFVFHFHVKRGHYYLLSFFFSHLRYIYIYVQRFWAVWIFIINSLFHFSWLSLQVMLNYTRD